MDIWSKRVFQTTCLMVPVVMLVGGLVFFIPRTTSFYQAGGSLNWGNLAFASLAWLIPAWALLFGAAYIERNRVDLAHTPDRSNLSEEAGQTEAASEGRLSARLLRPFGPLHGWKAVLVFLVVALLIFNYFEVRFAGFYLRGLWEVSCEVTVQVSFFLLAFLSMKWLPSWRVYIAVWILWGILWDTTVPGFVYVPNLNTWHEWMFPVAAARFVVEGYL